VAELSLGCHLVTILCVSAVSLSSWSHREHFWQIAMLAVVVMFAGREDCECEKKYLLREYQNTNTILDRNFVVTVDELGSGT